MLSIALHGQTLSVSERGGTETEVHFDYHGIASAIRIKHPRQTVIHALEGSRLPKHWKSSAIIERHEPAEFANKLRYAMRRAVCA